LWSAGILARAFFSSAMRATPGVSLWESIPETVLVNLFFLNIHAVFNASSYFLAKLHL
jgi:hypothetical protein